MILFQTTRTADLTMFPAAPTMATTYETRTSPPEPCPGAALGEGGSPTMSGLPPVATAKAHLYKMPSEDFEPVDSFQTPLMGDLCTGASTFRRGGSKEAP